MADPTDHTDPTPEPNTPELQPVAPSGPSAGEAWDDVISRMTDLGDAVGRWAKAAANDPNAHQKLDQVRTGINDIAQKADAALGHVVHSEFGQQVKGGAEQAGQAISDAAQQMTQAAAPHVRNAFAGLSDVFGKAAAKMDEAAARNAETAEFVAPEPTVEPAEPDDSAEPVTPVEPVERGSEMRP